MVRYRERQSRFRLTARCPARAGQARVVWRRIEELCEWKRPWAPSVRSMFDDARATPAELSFLRDPWIGGMISFAPRGDEGEGEDSR